MRKKKNQPIFIFSFFGILLLFTITGGLLYYIKSSQLFAQKSHAAGQIQHIVIFSEENRTFDGIFGTFPGANGATTYKDLNNVTHPLNHQPNALLRDMAHTYSAFTKGYNNGQMNGFSQVAGAIQNNTDESDSQFYQTDIPNYWKYAQNFTLTDNFFSTNVTNSYPNHLQIIAAQDNNTDSVPQNTSGNRWGCDAPTGAVVEQRQPNGTTQNVYPCFDFQTLGDSLNNANISWKYYAPGLDQAGYQWATYDSIKHIRNTSQWAQHEVDYSQFIKDAQSGTLPSVSWLTEPFNLSDHPPSGICEGENFAVQQINAVMQNPTLWANTVIILTWDDFGGFYDHVAPPRDPSTNSLLHYGIRVPTIILSPYAKGGYIDHTFYSFPSILKFVETTYGLPSLTTLDANATDLGNTLDLTQTPLSPLLLQTRATCPNTTPNNPPGITPQPTPPSATPTASPTLTINPSVTPTDTPTPSPTPTPVVSPTPTPTPISNLIAKDTFLRPDQSFWGTASDGQLWGGTANTSTAYSISNNVGKIAPTAAMTNTAILGPSLSNAEVLMNISSNVINVSNTIGSTLRWTSNSNFYRAYIDGGSLWISKNVNGTITKLASVPFTAIVNTSYTIKFNATGTVLSAKVWQTTTPEPTNWMVTTTDTSFSSAGNTGIRFAVQTGTIINVTFFQTTQL